MSAEAPEIDHPQVRRGRLTHFYSPKHGWEFNLDELPDAFQGSRVSLSRLLNPDQGWKAEGFRNFGMQSPPMFQFVFHTSTPPLRYEPAGFFLGKVSRLNLPEVLNQQGSRLTLPPTCIDYDGSQGLRIAPTTIGPFLTPESLEQSVVPFAVGGIQIEPFRLVDVKRPGCVGGEDPTRMVIEVTLQQPEEVIDRRIVLRREGWLRQAIELLTARQPDGLVRVLSIEADGLQTLSSLAALEGFDRKLLERLRSLPSPM